MATDSLNLTADIPASPQAIYDAWMDAKKHAEFTGAAATGEPRAGGRFSAWDGYIEGTTLELEPGKRIVQAWRTTEFPPGSPDSRVEVNLEPTDGGTHITLLHTEIPEGQGASYESGWEEYYFQPLRDYFGD
jgi:uncharacterized protein YndB with AHSA1/START domain